MAKQIQSTFDTRCVSCGTPIAVGGWCYYDATAARGQRTRCLNCKPDEAADNPAAELAKLKAQLRAREEAEQANTVPTPAPKPVEAPADPLAMAIAKAIEPMIQGKLDKEAVMAMIRQHMTPPVQEIVVKTPAIPEGVNMGRQHKQFELLLKSVNARMDNGRRLNVQLVGSAGTGKSVAAENVSIALGMKFSLVPTLTESHKFFGYHSPGTGKYITTSPREVWETGGVLCLDDFDGTDPVVGVELMAIRNGGMAFPDGYVKRSPDCCVVMTMNTWGNGATNEYCGRLKQDAAFLDGFVGIDWQVDESLERDTCSNPSWVAYVQTVRKKAAAKGMKVLITPRASYFGTALLNAGIDLETVKMMAIGVKMSPEQWRSVC